MPVLLLVLDGIKHFPKQEESGGSVEPQLMIS